MWWRAGQATSLRGVCPQCGMQLLSWAWHSRPLTSYPNHPLQPLPPATLPFLTGTGACPPLCHPAYSCLCVVLTFNSYLLSVGKLPLQSFSCSLKPRTPLLSPIQALCDKCFLGRFVLVTTISLDDCIPFDVALGIWSFSLIPSSFSWLQISEVPSTSLRKPWRAFHC